MRSMNRIETKKLSKNELLSLNFLRDCAIIRDDETPALARERQVNGWA